MKMIEQLKSLVDQMPDPDARNMYTTDIDKEKIERAVAAIVRGGRDSVQGLIDMLGQPGVDEYVKPRYALHCVLNHTLIAKDDQARREFSALLATNLSGDLSVDSKAYLCQELQWMGREEAVSSLGQLLLDERLVEAAAMALVAIKTGAALVLRTALANARGKCRLNIIDALAALPEHGAVKEMTDALKDDDMEVRIAARAGLARTPDATTADSLIQSIGGTSGWERTQTAKSCLVSAESLADAGKTKEARQMYDRIAKSYSGESESHVREAAASGLMQLQPS